MSVLSYPHVEFTQKTVVSGETKFRGEKFGVQLELGFPANEVDIKEAEEMIREQLVKTIQQVAAT